ncbi:phage tail protein [Salmonella enterica subsp. enterica serovar Nima]|nr:phage tail protein [Salmonella enterica subsp. enterica serovar Tennessee]EBU6847983.1 phage tail protein [Salmonella enterica subsp. enterica serovar Tennessee]ECD9288014.1 phage tail protein [Salmonella enterica subsp. houtenae]ECF3302820.1 phage tail protein [Salmonella enterica subsp. enterica serovar Nima]ECH7614782.1 phage tail protein [Salmonella enterica subsp. enterica serovar Tennessee]
MPAFPKFKTIITDYGKQRLIAAMSPGGTKLTLTQMAVGDGGGNPTNPDTTSTALVNEVWRAAVNSVTVDKKHPNIIIVELLIPAEVGGFWVREAGIYDEFNKLVAICSLPASEKPLLEQGSGRAQTVRMTLIVSDTSIVNITIDSTTIIATNDYVDNSLKEHEKSRNHPDATLTDKGFVQLSSATGSTDETKAATPKAVKAAMDNANKRQPGNENLTALSSLAGQPDKLPYFTNKGAMSLAEFAEFMRTMLSKTDAASVLEYLGLRETINLAAGALQKSQNGGDIPDKGLFAQNIGAALAFSGGIHIGGDSNPWTTAEFIAWLESQGVFNHRYWMCRGSWSYADNKTITDTGCGNICLAGAVVEVMGFRGAMTIRVTTPTTTSGGGVASAQFTYIDNGGDYSPGWRRDFNTINKPTAGDVGALPVTGGRLNGPLGIGTDNALGGNSLVLGDNDTGFKQDGDGVLGIYANNARVGYIDNSGLHMSVDVLTNGGIRAGDGKRLSLTSNNNSTMTATFNLWGDVNRPTVIELDDDQGWQFYSQRNTDGSISFRVNGQMEPNSYSNFDSRYVQDIRLGSLQYGQVWNGPGFSDTSGYVITGIINGNSDELVDGAHRRPIQKLIGNQWYNVVSI